MSETSSLLLKVLDGGIARVTFDRPQKRNALDQALLQGFLDILIQLREEPDVRVIVTTGAGEQAYSSGLDLHFLRENSSASRPWHPPSLLTQVMEELRAHPKITVAMVRGYCLGGGLALVNAHDLAVAARSAQFGMPEILRGSFGQIATASLFHAGVPLKKAFRMQLTGRNLTGVEAERLGLVSDVVDDADLEDYTLELAREIATHAPAALEHAKIAAYMGEGLDYPRALRIDNLVGARMRLFTNPLGDVEGYLASQRRESSVDAPRP